MQDPRDININDYDYDLPVERIALFPLPQRDQSKLLVWKGGRIQDAEFSDLADHVPGDACLVFNHSSVINARLYFKNAKGSPIEVFCLEPEGEIAGALQTKGEVLWQCMVGRLKKWGDEQLVLRHGLISLYATLVEKRKDHVLVRFNWEPAQLPFEEVITLVGSLPVPPYLNRPAEEIDKTRYQTIYAKEKGSVAAPTAGLHFTGPVLERLQQKGVRSCHLSLHVGSGTFKPVKGERVGEHEMHAEWLSIDKQALLTLLEFCEKKMIAVGTTSLRAIESLYWLGKKIIDDPLISQSALSVGQWEPYEKSAQNIPPAAALNALLEYMEKYKLQSISCKSGILIAPPYKMRLAGGLITNFHQPRSTLLLLVSAFAGEDWKKIYRHALEGGYRFLSYGDSSLLLE